MARNKSTVYYARNLSDVLFQLKTVPDLKILGGCTLVDKFPSSSLIVGSIPDFLQIAKHERFIDFGAAVTMNQIIDLGKKNMPQAFYYATQSIGNPIMRNIATIGGNICSEGIKKTLFAPLLAMDAMLEIHSATETSSIPIGKFTTIPKGYCLTKVRVPINDWDIEVFKKVGPSHSITENSASFVFLAATKKGVLSDLRIAFSGILTLRSRELENAIIGSRLPLSEKQIQQMLLLADKLFDTHQEYLSITCHPILKAQYINLIRSSLEQLT